MNAWNKLIVLSLNFLLVVVILTVKQPVAAESVEVLLERAIAGDHRQANNIARDKYRHPAETLFFLGLKPDMSVVEIWPSRGWYTEILAPVLREHGKFYAASFSTTANRTPGWRKNMHKGFMGKMAKRPDVYDHVIVTELSVPERTTIAPPGSVDMVLTFRNVHNWMKGDYAEQMFKVMSLALKPGGILGAIEHRARPGTSVTDMKRSGYVTEAHVIALAKQAGLVLEDSSDINANPRDTKDHPKGVWTLPPSLRYCRSTEADKQVNTHGTGTEHPIGPKEECIKHYTSIGESDRMTLRFHKSGS